MSGIKRFLKYLSGNNKMQISFCIVSVFMLLIVYMPVMHIVKMRVLSEMEVSTDFSIFSHVELVKKEKDKLVFDGWILRENSKNSEVFLILQDVNGEHVEILPVQMYEKSNIEEYFGWKKVEDKSGFTASIASEKVENNRCYELQIVLKYNEFEDGNVENIGSRKKIFTGKYLYNEELLFYNPNAYTAPVVNDSDFNMAIEAGKLLSYDMENECWIYEYESSLYCIFGSSLFSTLELQPEIPLFVYTSQIDKLPAERRKSGKDYIGYYLNSEDINKIAKDDCFLYKVLFPDDYPITRVQTGVYLNNGNDIGWKWQADIKNIWFD